MGFKESGQTIKLTVVVHMNKLIEPNMLETGKKINNTVLKLKHGQILLVIKECGVLQTLVH